MFLVQFANLKVFVWFSMLFKNKFWIHWSWIYYLFSIWCQFLFALSQLSAKRLVSTNFLWIAIKYFLGFPPPQWTVFRALASNRRSQRQRKSHLQRGWGQTNHQTQPAATLQADDGIVWHTRQGHAWHRALQLKALYDYPADYGWNGL